MYSVKDITMDFNQKLKRILALIVLVVVVFSAIKVTFTPNFDAIFADTPNNQPFYAPSIENSDFERQRSYTDMDFTATVKDFDKRNYVLDQYFLRNDSPLYGTAKYFTQACNKYNAPRDCTVVAAIAMNETHLCKYKNSAQMFNCWGFGGPDIHRITFKSFEDGIDRVTDVLANQYGYEYMINPSLMDGTFCGSEPGCTNWGNGIKKFMNEINKLSLDLGMGDLYALR